MIIKRAFLVAGSRQAAATVAEVDWCWTAIGASTWRSLANEIVTYAGSLDSLRGRESGTKVYFGHGWQGNRHLRGIEGLLTEGRIMKAEP